MIIWCFLSAALTKGQRFFGNRNVCCRKIAFVRADKIMAGAGDKYSYCLVV